MFRISITFFLLSLAIINMLGVHSGESPEQRPSVPDFNRMESLDLANFVSVVRNDRFSAEQPTSANPSMNAALAPQNLCLRASSAFDYRVSTCLYC